MDYSSTFSIYYDNICLIVVTNYEKPKNKNNMKDLLNNLDIKPVFKCNNNNIDCYICLDKIDSKEYVRELSCNHKYHKKCIDKWLVKMSKEKENISCPICRKNIEIKNKISIHDFGR